MCDICLHILGTSYDSLLLGSGSTPLRTGLFFRFDVYAAGHSFPYPEILVMRIVLSDNPGIASQTFADPSVAASMLLFSVAYINECICIFIFFMFSFNICIFRTLFLSSSNEFCIPKKCALSFWFRYHRLNERTA